MDLPADEGACASDARSESLRVEGVDAERPRLKVRRGAVSRRIDGRHVHFEASADGRADGSGRLWVDHVAIELPLEAWDAVITALADDTRAAMAVVPPAPRVAPPRMPGTPPRTGTSWSPDEDERLMALFEAGKIPETIAFELQRTRGAVIIRLEKMGLVKRGVLRPDFAGAQRRWSSEQALEDSWPPPR